MKVVYGHTDSIYCQVDSVEKAQSVLSTLNEHVRSKFPNVLGLDEHPVTLEFEKYFRTLGVGATKNRNAGLITWKDGEFLEEEEFVMTGFTAKRISETPLDKEVQITVLNMWVDEKSEEEVVSYLNDIYENVKSGKVEIQRLLKRSRYRPERFHVICQNCDTTSSLMFLTKAVCCENPQFRTVSKLGKGWKSAGKSPVIGSGIIGTLLYNKLNREPIDDSYLYLKVKNNPHTIVHPIKQIVVKPDYYSALKIEDFSNFTPDWGHYAESIIKKASPVFRAMGWDDAQIRKDSKQKTLDEWF